MSSITSSTPTWGIICALKKKFHRLVRDLGCTNSGYLGVLTRYVSVQIDVIRPFLVLTLRVNCLPLLGVGRIRIVAVSGHLSVLLGVYHASWLLRRILALVLSVCALVADRRKRRSGTILLVAGLLNMLRIRLLSFNLLRLLSGGRSLAFLVLFADRLFLLFASLPLLSNLLEFCTR